MVRKLVAITEEPSNRRFFFLYWVWVCCWAVVAAWGLCHRLASVCSRSRTSGDAMPATSTVPLCAWAARKAFRWRRSSPSRSRK
jgi:hypothetical protein